MKSFDEQLVSGSILRSVWKLAWPVIALNLVNGAHGWVDHILLGHFTGGDRNAANAAVGASWTSFLVIVVFIASVFHGMNVLMARYAGRQDRDMMSKVFWQALITTVFVLVVVLAPIGYVAAPYLLDLINTPEEVLPHALPYLRTLFTLGTPLFMMFLFTGAFQASGDPKTPLFLGIVSSALNIGISTVLIMGLGPIPALGTLGAALGTVCATSIGSLIALYLILSKRMIVQPPARWGDLLPDFTIIKRMGSIGIPTGITGVLLNAGGVGLMFFLGTVENNAAAWAAYTICYTQVFNLISWTAFGLRASASTLMGQNLGAQQPDRARLAVYMAAGFGLVWASAIGLLYWFAPQVLLSLFDVTDPLVASMSTSLLQYLSLSGLVLALALAFTGGLQGAGDTKTPMWIAFATQIGLLLGSCLLLKQLDMLTAERIWMVILISHTARLALTYAAFHAGRWQGIKVEVEA